MNFDRGYPKSGRIYRIETGPDSARYTPLMSQPLAELLTTSIPDIEQYSISSVFCDISYFTIEVNEQKQGYHAEFRPVTSNYLDVFEPEFIVGGTGLLRSPDHAIVPLSLATKLFGSDPGSWVGQIIVNEDDQKSYKVEAVYRDFPTNSSCANSIYIKAGDRYKTAWGTYNYNGYVIISQAASPEDVALAMEKILSQSTITQWVKEDSRLIRLTALEEVYYQSDTIDDWAPKGRRAVTSILIMIVILIIAIASINFINFATALTPLRIKSINTQKVLGSTTSQLRWAQIFEAIGISLMAYLLSLIWISIADDLGFSQYLMTSISLGSNLTIVGFAALIALIVGLLAGLYPALYSTSFQPALVLKGSFGLSPRGRILRMVLIGIQFVISIGLIIAALFMQLQNGFIIRHDSGMECSRVAVVKMSKIMADPEKRATIVSELKSNTMIQDVAFADEFLGLSDTYTTLTRGYEDRDIEFDMLVVSHNFCDLMGLKITDGRDFNESESHIGDRVIFNETARKLHNLQLDHTIMANNRDTVSQIVGFVKDFNFKSLRYNIQPLMLYLSPPTLNKLSVAYIKTTGDPYQAADLIKSTFSALDPIYPLEVQFYDSAFDKLYQKERKTTTLVTIFSLLAVVISLIGVFGIVVFETQYRRKEIGIRKIYGSTVNQILTMLNRKFIWTVLICFLVATPVAWYFVQQWLSSFAYRTPIHWWVFTLSLIIVMFITLLTVTIQAWRAATENPVHSLKSE